MSRVRRLIVTAVAVALATVALPSEGQAQKPAGKKPTCQLEVINRTPFRVLVYIDGSYWGWVNAHRSFTFSGVPGGDTSVYGTTQYNEYFWGPQSLACQGTATWKLAF